MTYAHEKISLMQKFLSCIFLQSNGPRDKKGARKARSERAPYFLRRVLVFTDSDPAQPKVMVVGETADPTTCNTPGREGRLLRDDVGERNTMVAPEVLPNRSRTIQVWELTCTAAKKPNTSKTRNGKKDEEDDHGKGEQHSEDGQAAVMPSENKEEAPFDEKVSFECMRHERIPVNYRDKNLKL